MAEQRAAFDNVKELRNMAERCRSLAQGVSDASIRCEWYTIASRCEHLAEKIEREKTPLKPPPGR